MVFARTSPTLLSAPTLTYLERFALSSPVRKIMEFSGMRRRGGYRESDVVRWSGDMFMSCRFVALFFYFYFFYFIYSFHARV